jgi:membrane protein DedA with SNARE-associated domain
MDYFARYGAWIIFAARFLPGLRAPLFLTAGTMKVPFWVFFAMDGAAALLSIPISFYVAYYFTDKLTEMLHASHRVMYWAVGAVLVCSLGGHWFWSWLTRRRKARVQAAVGAPAPVEPGARELPPTP